jgi:hypothetical protein
VVVLCWLLVEYPYGLLLFAFSACWYGALHRTHQLPMSILTPEAESVLARLREDIESIA